MLKEVYRFSVFPVTSNVCIHSALPCYKQVLCDNFSDSWQLTKNKENRSE